MDIKKMAGVISDLRKQKKLKEVAGKGVETNTPVDVDKQDTSSPNASAKGGYEQHHGIPIKKISEAHYRTTGPLLGKSTLGELPTRQGAITRGGNQTMIGGKRYNFANAPPRGTPASLTVVKEKVLDSIRAKRKMKLEADEISLGKTDTGDQRGETISTTPTDGKQFQNTT